MTTTLPHPLALASFMVMSAAWLAAADTPESNPAVLRAELINAQDACPTCHASTIAETRQHGLVAAWFGGTAEWKPDGGIWLSRMVDGKWTPPVEAANGLQATGPRVPVWNPVLFQPREGPLMLFYKDGSTESKSWGMLTTSNDGGRTWSTPQRLPDGILGPAKDKPVQLADGAILCGASAESADQPPKWTVLFERTSDWGKTWTATGPVNDGLILAAIQPTILFQGGARLQAMGRTRQDKIFQVWSDDNGKTWGAMTLTELPNPNSGIDAVTLADHRQLLVYNPTTKGRTPLAVAISSDGKKWKDVLTLEDAPVKNGYSYPAVIQSADGFVHITYSWNRKKIKYVEIDPAKL